MCVSVKNRETKPRTMNVNGNQIRPHIDSSTFSLGNDPSAGSPTETLLRLLLPLDNVVRSNFQSESTHDKHSDLGPKTSLSHPIGSSDGRCVQRAGT